MTPNSIFADRRALIGFAHEMDVSVIAEAVETREQLQVLDELGTHYVQGYHVGRPLPLDEQPFSETPEGKRKAIGAAARTRRRERRGERRSRGRG